MALSKKRKNSKYFFNYANKFSKTKNKIGLLVNQKGEVVKDSYAMAELLTQNNMNPLSVNQIQILIYI